MTGEHRDDVGRTHRGATSAEHALVPVVFYQTSTVINNGIATIVVFGGLARTPAGEDR
jgi:hypothetical protein